MKDKCWECGSLTEIKLREWSIREIEEDVKKVIKLSKTQEKFEGSFERVFCDMCFENFKEQKQQNLEQYLKLKTIIMHERALRYMEKSNSVFMSDLKEASEFVYKQAVETNCFMSSHEMIAAIILYDEFIKYLPQQKVGQHTVDFLLPEIKAVLEIDGYMHNYRKKEDSTRDIEVKSILGKGWEIVRIKTNYIEENPAMLYPAIEQVLNHKRIGTLKAEQMIYEYYKSK